MITMYLAGSIRDKRQDDIDWREDIINALSNIPVKIINPLGGKHYDEKTGMWTVSGNIVPTAKFIVDHDFWSVDHCNVAVFNFTALTEKYPNIGTLIEFGRSTARSMLRYSIIDKTYKGHENEKLYNLHPFIAENSAGVFHSVHSCISFLRAHLLVLAGEEPHYND